MGRKRFPCPCCGQLTLDEPDAYEICSKCNWEDDGDEHPWSISGPNHMSLWEGQLRWRDNGLSKTQRRRALEELRAAEAARRLPDHLAKLRRALGTPLEEMVDHEEAHRLSLELWNDDRAADSDHRTTPAITAALEGLRVPRDLDVLVLSISYDGLFGAPMAPAHLVVERWQRVMEVTHYLSVCTRSLQSALLILRYNDDLEVSAWGAFAL